MSSLLVFNRVFRLEITSVMLLFSTTFSLTFLLTPPPFPKYRKCVAVGRRGGEGVLNFVVDHILQEFKTLFLTRFRT